MAKQMICGKVVTNKDYLTPVTYVPKHANGDPGHKDAEIGVIIRVTQYGVKVLYCKSRTVQLTNPEDLVFG